MLTISAIPAFSDNYIWCLSDTQSKKAMVVDPGQAEPVLEHLNQHGLELDCILITHHHPDHVGGVAKLVSACRPERVVVPAESPFQQGSVKASAGDTVEWHGLAFKVIPVPGHTLDHIAFYSATAVDGHPVLFCGDTLFVCGCGRLFEGSPSQMRTSLAALRGLPDSTAIYCAHEYTLANLRYARHLLPQDEALAQFEAQCQARRDNRQPTVPSLLGNEKRLNPFLRWDDAMVIDAATRYAAANALNTGTADDVFAAVRHGKDHF